MARDVTQRLTCVLPAFNEAESLPASVAEWSAALERCTGEHEIIVVDDGSTDDTPAVLRRLAARYDRLRIVTHPRNLGYGAALANGFAQASFPLLFFTDADGQYEPEDIHLLLERIGEADIVVGYRVGRADSRLRCALSRGYNFLARAFLGVSLRDFNCAFKLMLRDGVQRLGMESTGFGVNAELAWSAGAAGMTIAEVPVRHRPRRAGRSTVRPIHVLAAVYGLARVRTRRRPTPAGAAVAPGASSFALEKTALPRRPAG
jgi:glycosyltransferase involved in cell wall biosynthesis